MIFNNNHTSLGSTIPMAEGYDCSFGAPLTLIEGARNDFEMFKAMLNADYRELAMRESGYVNESEITSLNEAVGGGIFKKIAELLRKLIAKIKAIFHTFVGKMNGLFMKDKDLVKKYEKEVLNKKNINNLEVKWRKPKSDPKTLVNSLSIPKDIADVANIYNEDRDKIYKYFTNQINNNLDWDDFDKDFEELCFDDEENIQIKEISGGIRSIMNDLVDYNKTLNEANKFVKNQERECSNLEKEADKRAKEIIDANKRETDKDSQDLIDQGNNAYTVTVCYHDVTTKALNAYISAIKTAYKYERAAFNKAITANNAKLKEATYLDAVAEAAADEVDAVIDDALKKEEISDLCAASTNVKDGDVSDDPEKLVYDKVQKYSDDADMDTAQGTKDTNINSNESAFFGQLLY